MTNYRLQIVHFSIHEKNCKEGLEFLGRVASGATLSDDVADRQGGGGSRCCGPRNGAAEVTNHKW